MQLNGFLDPMFDFLGEFLLTPFVTDSAFRTGYFWGLGSALFVGLLSRELLYWRGKILAFFAPSRQPATQNGPAPFSVLVGCIGAALALIMFVGLLGGVIFLR